MGNDQSSLAIKYFLDNFPVDVLFSQTRPSNKSEELAHYYLEKLTEVFAVFDRLIKYEKYFKEFLPPEGSGISESEAIEYHLRSYIGDFYILQERIRKITDKLIDDLPNYNSDNQDVAKEAIRHLSEQIHTKFKKITSGLRREHVHERSITELDLVTGKFLSSLVTGEMPLPAGVSLDGDRVKARRDEVVKTTKEKHIKRAAENSNSLRKMKEWFATIFIFIFSNLNGHKIEGLSL